MRLYYISVFRVVAMFSILACHIAQANNSSWAFALNGAVYGFLLISGMLLARKPCGNIGQFLKSRLMRVLIPYYLLLVLYMVLYGAGVGTISIGIVSNVLCLQWLFPGLENTGHLWYVSCIVLCYLLTPILDKITSKISVKKIWFWIFAAVAALVSLILSAKIGVVNFLFPFTFALGYAYIRLYRAVDDRALDAYEKALVVFGYFFMLARIIGEYFMGISFHSLLGDISEIAFSFALVLALKVLFSGRSSTNHLAAGVKKVVSFFDTISYEVYLMHHMFILGGWL